MKFPPFKYAVFLFVFLLSAPAAAQPVPRENESTGESGLPIPRFVSISAREANLRAGPGEQYPIEWVYNRALYPLEVIGEYENWRQVRDIDGTEGWMHVALLSGKRTALVTAGPETLYEDPSEAAFPAARVEAGVVGEILECTPVWCRVDFAGNRGWIRTRALWGTYRDEVIE